MSKTVWLVNQYATTPDLSGDGHRHYYLAKELRKNGYEVIFITGSFVHSNGKELEIKANFEFRNDEFPTVLVRTPKYKGAKGVGRLWNMIIFWLKLYFLRQSKLSPPDIILVSSISLLPILNVLVWRKRFRHAKFVLEIRDIWPLTLVEVGGFSRHNPLIGILGWIEKLGYKNADHIVGLMPHLDEHVEKVLGYQCKSLTWISNGIDLETMEKIEPLDAIDDSIWPLDHFVIGYAGSIGSSNSLDTIIEYMNTVNPESGVTVVIVGKGDKKADLMQKSKNKEQVLFYDRIPKGQLQALYSKMDALYINIPPKNIYKFGVSMNKIFEYMYASKPIIVSGSIRSNAISEKSGGIVIECDSASAIADAIMKLKGLSDKELEEMGRNAKRAVIDNFTYQKLGKDYAELFARME